MSTVTERGGDVLLLRLRAAIASPVFSRGEQENRPYERVEHTTPRSVKFRSAVCCTDQSLFHMKQSQVR
ncbi:hypothetical protein Mapa_003718 [Marchantia paleacea]|nr:hypothetical protein Mapa_003718 [Marchantia paleacea]